MVDLISRQAAIEAVIAYNLEEEGDTAALMMILKGLPAAEPFISDDGTVMISVSKGQLDKVGRVIVLEESTKYCKVMYEPERKKGKWIDNHTTCSECGWQMIDDVLDSPNMVGFKFCPNCGADMRGDADADSN